MDATGWILKKAREAEIALNNYEEERRTKAAKDEIARVEARIAQKASNSASSVPEIKTDNSLVGRIRQRNKMIDDAGND